MEIRLMGDPHLNRLLFMPKNLKGLTRQKRNIRSYSRNLTRKSKKLTWTQLSSFRQQQNTEMKKQGNTSKE